MKLIAPKHVLLIPDGNRRYAKRMKVALSEAYAAGGRKAIEAAEFFLSHNTDGVTIYALAKYNLKRGDKFFDSFKHAFITVLPELYKLKKEGIKINFIGNIDLLFELEEFITVSNENDKNNFFKNKELCILYGYSFRDDFNGAMQRLIQKNKEIIWENIREEFDIKNDFDLVIRTGGQMRFSEGPVYAMRQAYFISIEELIPEIKEEDLQWVLEQYSFQAEAKL